MKLRRLLLSIGIAVVMVLGLMAGLRGVPVVQAQGEWWEDGPENYALNVNGSDCPTGGNDPCASDWHINPLSGRDGIEGHWTRPGGCDGSRTSGFRYMKIWDAVSTTYGVLEFDVETSGTSNGAYGDALLECYVARRAEGDDWPADLDSIMWTDNIVLDNEVLGDSWDASFALSHDDTWWTDEGYGGVAGFGIKCRIVKETCDVAVEMEITNVTFNGDPVSGDVPTGCTPIESLVVTGPVTGTAGQANSFKGTASPSESVPIDWSWEASGDGLAVDDDSEDYQSLADLTWWFSGTKTVTTTACNCAGCMAVTNTIAITGLSWTPPFSTTFPTPPEFPPDCNCPDPSYFGILEVGHWINWLWCNLKCWILFFLDFLYWLWELLQWVFYTIANTFLFYFWVLTTSAAMQADMYFRSGANWIDESSEALGDFVQALVFDIRDKIHASMTKWADWVDVSFDELGNWLQESVYNVRDWSHITLVDSGEYLNDFFTNLGEGWAGSIINIRDWSYDFLTMVGDFFASWGTNLGDFLAESTYRFRDWTYESLTNLANFVRDSGDNIGNAAEDFVLKIDEWLYDTLTKLGELLNEGATSIGDYLSALILAIDEWLYDFLTRMGETLNAWIRFIGDVLASFLLFINAVVGGTLAGIYAVVAAQAYLFGLILDMLDIVITMMLDGLNTILFILDLLIGMLTGVKDALDAQTKAELFQGEAFYFWRGLEFFESAIGDTPLTVLNSITIGLMGFRLGMWTVGQAADFLEDIARY